MQILFRDLSLRSLDAFAADSLVLFIDQQERPLQGLAGLCDWRLCGQLSRVLNDGFFEGKGGEALLMPIGHRLGIVRLLAFGLGENGTASETLVDRAFGAVGRAGGRSLVLSIDALGATSEQAAAVWLRASRDASFQRQLLVSGDRGLARVVRAAVGGDPGFQFEGEPGGSPHGQRLG